MPFVNPNLLPSVDSTFDVASLDLTWAVIGSNLWSHGIDLTQSLQGAGSFKFTNDTAGAVTVGPNRVEVTPGSSYVLWAPIRTSSTQTGLTTTLTLTWYAQKTGGSTVGTPVTFTAPLTGTTSGYADANAVNVFGTAPAGANYVKLGVGVSGLPARTDVWLDSIYFGEFGDQGNLLPPAEASFENGPGGWTATGATLSRATATAGNGNYSLHAVSSAASVVLESPTYNAVVPGDNLVGTLWVGTSAVGLTADIGIRWYSSSHTALSDTTVSVPLTVSSQFFEYVFTGTAPASAAFARVVIKYTNTVGQGIYLDNVELSRPVVDPAELLTYAQATFEAAMPSWTVDNGTIEQFEYQIVSLSSAHIAKITPDGSGQLITATMTDRISVTAGTPYLFTVQAGRHITESAETTMSTVPSVIFYDASGNVLPPLSPTWLQNTSSHEVAWFFESESFQVPDEAVSAALSVKFDPTSSPLIDWFFVDNLSLTTHELLAVASADNDTGRVDLSIVWTDDSEHPRDGYLSVRRVDQDGALSYVRTVWGDSSSMRFSDTGTPVVLEDYEAPLGTSIWYIAEWFNPDGTRVGLVELGTTDSPVLDSDYVWLKSPGQPAFQTKLVPEHAFSWTRAARNAAYDVVGRTNPIVWSDVRAGRQSSATFLALDTVSHIQLDALLALGTPVLIQAMPGLGADGNHYFVVGDVSPEPINNNASLEGWRWTLDLTEIDRPLGAIQGSAENTWQDLVDEGGFWLDEATDSLTWADLLTS